jgi:glycosyltransferase involved in cell wall biosynthesis
MACELPVISSNAGGIPELNVDGETGFLCNVGDVQGMAEKAIYLLEDESRLLQFKANAKKRAAKFDINQIVPLYEAFYTKTIEASAPMASK